MNIKFKAEKDREGFIFKIRLEGVDLDYSKVPKTFRSDLEGGWHGSLDVVADGTGELKGYVRVTSAFVAKDLRGKSLGTQLYKETLKWLKSNGYNGIYSRSGQRVSDEAEALWNKIRTRKIKQKNIEYDIMENIHTVTLKELI